MFLSGDVHYGISAELDYYKKGEPEASRFVQMVASSFKNSKPEGQLLGLLPAAFAQTALAGGLNREFSELDLFAWEEDADIKNLKFRFQTEPGQFRDANPGEFPLRYAYALKKKPVFFPLRDWPLTVFQPKDGSGNPIGDETILKRIVLGSAVPQPSYRWRMKIEIDDRPDNIRLASLGAGFLLDPTADLPNQIDAGSQRSFDTVLKRNSFFSRSHMSRFVNWYSHVAFVHFEKLGDSFNTHHSQFFQPDLPGDEFKPTDTELTYKPGTFQQPYFRHTISLKNAAIGDQPILPTEKAGTPI
ncbi:hypothetical protein GO730_32835 [Spirosoma sp. HMF3257]|uniref:hypothetical protein n=1 Tax=Spirosoma telluris TaxID=2183553 RepID=UPI0012F9BA0A|nr:hypothetical protein [Spirosoma telluris]